MPSETGQSVTVYIGPTKMGQVMKNLVIVSIVGLIVGCSERSSSPQTTDMAPIPGQPERIQLPQQGAGDGNCFEEDMFEPSLASYLSSLDQVVWGKVGGVELVLEEVESKTGELVDASECELGVTHRILKVQLRDAVSLFDGPLGEVEFFVPSGAVESWQSRPLYLHEGHWMPNPTQQDLVPARIDGSIGWTQADAGVQIGQELLVGLLANQEGKLVSNRIPLYEKIGDAYVAVGWDGNFIDRDRTSCFLYPSPLNAPFTIESLQDAYTSGEAEPPGMSFEQTPDLTLTSTTCRYEQEPPLAPAESDMGSR